MFTKDIYILRYHILQRIFRLPCLLQIFKRTHLNHLFLCSCLTYSRLFTVMCPCDTDLYAPEGTMYIYPPLFTTDIYAARFTEDILAPLNTEDI